MDISEFFQLVQLIKRIERSTILRFVPAGLTKAEQKLLFALYGHRCHSEQHPMTVSELSDFFKVKRSSVIQLINTLVDRELVARQKSPHDQRVSYIVLTENGTTLAETLSEKNQQLVHAICQQIGPDKVTEALAVINQLVDLLEEQAITAIE